MASYRIVFDCKQRRPGCVLIQAGLGGMMGGQFSTFFPEETWLLFPSDDMRIYTVTDEQLPILSEMAKKAVNYGARKR